MGVLDGGTASALAWRALRGAMRLAQVRLLFGCEGRYDPLALLAERCLDGTDRCARGLTDGDGGRKMHW